MQKAVVVLRKLDAASPIVVTASIEIPGGAEHEVFAQHFLTEIKEGFIRQFCEFRTAEWTYQICDHY